MPSPRWKLGIPRLGILFQQKFFALFQSDPSWVSRLHTSQNYLISDELSTRILSLDKPLGVGQSWSVVVGVASNLFKKLCGGFHCGCLARRGKRLIQTSSRSSDMLIEQKSIAKFPGRSTLKSALIDGTRSFMFASAVIAGDTEMFSVRAGELQNSVKSTIPVEVLQVPRTVLALILLS